MRIKVQRGFSHEGKRYGPDLVYEVNTEESRKAKQNVEDWIEKGLVEEYDGDIDVDDRTEEIIRKAARAVVAEEKAARGRGPSVVIGSEGWERDEGYGFKNFGEFAQAVYRAATPAMRSAHGVDRRLLNIQQKQNITGFPTDGPTLTHDGTPGSPGESAGYLLAPGFLHEIQSYLFRDESLLKYTRLLSITTNSIDIPYDQTRPWDSTSGMVANWISEAGIMTQSLPVFGTVNLRPNKLAILAPVSEEMLTDNAATALDAWIGKTAGELISFEIDRTILAGSGSGQPDGVINHASSVEVTLPTSANAANDDETGLVYTLASMYARQENPSGAVWVANHNMFPALTMCRVGNQAAWVPPDKGIAGAPYGTIYGRPLILHHAAPGYADSGAAEGAINFLDLSGYVMASRGGIQSAMSIHLWFDYQVTAFRYTIRVDGKPWASVPIPASSTGGQTKSKLVIGKNAA